MAPSLQLGGEPTQPERSAAAMRRAWPAPARAIAEALDQAQSQVIRASPAGGWCTTLDALGEAEFTGAASRADTGDAAGGCYSSR